MELLLKASHAKRASKKRNTKVEKAALTVSFTKTPVAQGAVELRTQPGGSGRWLHTHIALLEFDGEGNLIRGITMPDETGHRHLVSNMRRTGPEDGKTGSHSHALPSSLTTSTESGPFLVLGSIE